MGSPKPAITEDEALEALWQTLQTCDDELDAKIKSATEGKTLGYIDSISYSAGDRKLTTTYHTLAYDSSTGEFSLNEASARELTHNAPTPRGITEIKEVDNSDEGKVYIQQTFTDGTTETVTIYVTNACGPKGDKGDDASQGFEPNTTKTDGSSISETGKYPGTEKASAEAAGITCSATALSMSGTAASLGVKGMSVTVGGVDLCFDGLFCATSGTTIKSDGMKNATNLGHNYAILVQNIADAANGKVKLTENKNVALEQEKAVVESDIENKIAN